MPSLSVAVVQKRDRGQTDIALDETFEVVTAESTALVALDAGHLEVTCTALRRPPIGHRMAQSTSRMPQAVLPG